MIVETGDQNAQVLRKMLIDALGRSRERLERALDGVSVEQANARPVDGLAPRIDSLTWLAWHTARAIDLQIAPLAGREPEWTAGGHSTRFGLPLPDDTEDWRHTPEESAQVTVSDLSVLTGYLDAVYAVAMEFLGSLDAARLDEVIDEAWDPPTTLGVRLVSIIDDASQHSGQAVYARRLLSLTG
ncbi:DinB family protein [Actinomyces respiraculi]|uniref:DinB family protein n=1 Tax=Actinomyces respiraculi TaxID=2744574 RepID=UPI0014242516|nr:DinB family protein [Actinomyces respiraculi]